jgi:hypothetical protein
MLFRLKPNSLFVIADGENAYASRIGKHPRDLSDWEMDIHLWAQVDSTQINQLGTAYLLILQHKENPAIKLYIRDGDILEVTL